MKTGWIMETGGGQQQKRSFALQWAGVSPTQRESISLFLVKPRWRTDWDLLMQTNSNQFPLDKTLQIDPFRLFMDAWQLSCHDAYHWSSALATWPRGYPFSRHGRPQMTCKPGARGSRPAQAFYTLPQMPGVWQSSVGVAWNWDKSNRFWKQRG